MELPAVGAHPLFRVEQGSAHAALPHEIPKVVQQDTMLATGGSLRLEAVGSDPVEDGFGCHIAEARSLPGR